MTTPKVRSTPFWKLLLIATFFVVVATILYRSIRAEIYRNSIMVVGLSGFRRQGQLRGRSAVDGSGLLDHLISRYETRSPSQTNPSTR
jgi:hypothetical protein